MTKRLAAHMTVAIAAAGKVTLLARNFVRKRCRGLIELVCLAARDGRGCSKALCAWPPVLGVVVAGQRGCAKRPRVVVSQRAVKYHKAQDAILLAIISDG
jgi:hypothetical protein